MTDVRTSVRFARISDQPLDVEAHRQAVASAGAGAEVVFCGVVRDHDHDRPVRALDYVAHPSAGDVLLAVADEVAADPAVVSVAVSHRVGAVGIGDVALVAAVSSAHRDEAFAACRRLVDEAKRQLPIWKRQVFDDGSDEWVNCP